MGEEGGTTAVKDIVLHIMPLFDAIHPSLFWFNLPRK